MKKLYQCIILIGIFLGFINHTMSVYAEGEVGFNIQAILPDNQLDKDELFFNLRMTPQKKQTIELKINNTSNEDMLFEINVNQAYTNNQGFIDYTDKTPNIDNSLPYNINDLVKYDKEVYVSAKTTKIVPFKITMPDEPYVGEILSGIQVLKKDNKEDAKDSIHNSVGYVLGLKLTESDVAVKRQMNVTSVKPQAKFGKPSIVATIQNPTMDSYGHLKYEAEIYKKRTKELFYKATYDNDMELAPNSSYPFAIELKNQSLIDGEYTLNLIVNDAKGNKWNFSEDFTVTKEEMNKINQITLNDSNKLSIPWLGVLIIMILIIVIGGVIILKRKKNY